MKNSVNSKIILSLTIAALSLTLGVALLYPNQVYSQSGNQAGNQAETNETTNETRIPIPTPTNCDGAYPDACIVSPPPDLNCPDVPYKGFTVLAPDPHGFDRDGDGVGCDS